MSIAAKLNLINQLKGNLSNTLTVDQLDTVVDVINDELSKYRMEIIDNGVYDNDSDELLRAFIEAKQIEGRSKRTVERYEYVIKRMMSEIHVPIRQITVFHLRKYLSEEKARGISDVTLEGTRSVFSSYFGWLANEGLLKENPCSNLSAIKCQKKVLTPYADDELERLKEFCKTARDRAIVSFLMSTGCRISEMCELNRNDINFRSKECVVHGKGNKDRTVYLNDVTIMLLKRYLDERTDDIDALFISRIYKRLQPGGVRCMLRKISASADVDHVHPHRFRRTLATTLINRGMPIQEVATILGHDKIDTTMRYIYIDKNDLHHSYRKYA